VIASTFPAVERDHISIPYRFAPFLNLFVIAAEKDFGDFPASKVGRASVLGAVADVRFGEGLVHCGIGVTQDTGVESGGGIEDHRSGQFASA